MATISQNLSHVTNCKMKSSQRLHRIQVDEQFAYRPPKKYTVHNCSSHCCSFDENPSILWKYGPLIWPLIIGWKRINKHEIFYITPCGLSMRDYRDVKRYLDVIKCDLLDVDNFCFERGVDCLREYISDEEHILSNVCMLYVQSTIECANNYPLSVYRTFPMASRRNLYALSMNSIRKRLKNLIM